MLSCQLHLLDWVKKQVGYNSEVVYCNYNINTLTNPIVLEMENVVG